MKTARGEAWTSHKKVWSAFEYKHMYKRKAGKHLPRHVDLERRETLSVMDLRLG